MAAVHSGFGNDGAGDESCRDVQQNSDASTARMAEYMINLSSGEANEDGIFLHANVRAARILGNASEAEHKTSKTTPCTVAGACENNDLRIIRNFFDSSGKTGAYWHHGGVGLLRREAASTTTSVIPREGGESSIPETPVLHTTAAAYWIARLRGR